MAAVNIVQFDIFKPFHELIHAFSTRKGGFSKPPYKSLNLGLASGDNSQIVQKNRDLFFNYLSVPKDQLVFPIQIHSKNIKVVNSPGVVDKCDALISGSLNLYLTIQTADCFPVYIFDPVTKTVGIIHSGWRGAASNITGNTIRKMVEHFDIDTPNLIAAIGPGVQTQNFQVDNLVYNLFKAKYFRTDGPEHYKMDLQQVIYDQLIDAGLNSQNIERNSDCTFENSDQYYSYRRDGKNSGRMMGVIGLKL